MRPNMVNLTEEHIERECAAIRQRLLALANHLHEMTKEQVVILAEQTIADMMTLLELSVERKQ